MFILSINTIRIRYWAITITASLLFLLVLSCTVPGLMGAVPFYNPPTQIQLHNLVTHNPNATATATPFLPLPPTPTYIPTAMPILAPTFNPQQENTFISTDGSTGIDFVNQTKGNVNILLLGSDQRPYEGGFRTDTIILLTLNNERGTANLTSFPRDLYVYIPGWKYERINTAMAYGGFPLLASTFEYNFGVRPDHYVMVNLWAFVQTVDSLGGITVGVARGLTDHRDGYGYYSVPAGSVYMGGDTALWYVRSRHTTSDFDRTRRQQEVVQALFSKLISLDGIKRAPELYDIYKQNVTTDLTWGDIASLLPMATKLWDKSRIHHYYVGPSEVTPWTTPGGAQVLLPQQAAILSIIQQALGFR